MKVVLLQGYGVIDLELSNITMNPVAVNMQCHSARRARVSITPHGVAYGF